MPYRPSEEVIQKLDEGLAEMASVLERLKVEVYKLRSVTRIDKESEESNE